MEPLWLGFLGSLAIDKTKSQPTVDVMRGQQRANFISLCKVDLNKLGTRLGAFFKFIDNGTEQAHSIWFVRVPPKLRTGSGVRGLFFRTTLVHPCSSGLVVVLAACLAAAAGAAWVSLDAYVLEA